MCVHDVEHDFKNSVFKVIAYVKYEFKFLLVLRFLTGPLVGGLWLVGWSVGRWSVVGGRLVSGLKEIAVKMANESY